MTRDDREADFNLPIGSAEAKAKGCICASTAGSADLFAADPDCPVHGLDALAAVLQDDDRKRKSPP